MENHLLNIKRKADKILSETEGNVNKTAARLTPLVVPCIMKKSINSEQAEDICAMLLALLVSFHKEKV